jgi:hypothetical protein
MSNLKNRFFSVRNVCPFLWKQTNVYLNWIFLYSLMHICSFLSRTIFSSYIFVANAFISHFSNLSTSVLLCFIRNLAPWQDSNPGYQEPFLTSLHLQLHRWLLLTLCRNKITCLKNIYNTQSSLVHFLNKKISFKSDKRSSLPQRWRWSCKFRSRRTS